MLLILKSIVFICLGICLVLYGANRMTDGAVAFAKRLHVPEMVIGLTIVACGTSMPEFFVSLTSSLHGSADMAVGNVVGSNIFNTLLIVGMSAMVMPMAIARSTVRKDIPFAILASLLLILLCLDGTVQRYDAIILFVLFLLFMWYTLVQAHEGKVDNAPDESGIKDYPVWKSLLLIVFGLAMLIVGSNVFVAYASLLAKTFGVSDAIIGLTIVACGTSMPELATSVVAAHKGQSELAIGNVLGSNVFNILMVLGLTGIITPLKMEGITTLDLGLQFFGVLLLWLFCYTKYKVERWEGTLLTAIFLIYMSYLVVEAL